MKERKKASKKLTDEWRRVARKTPARRKSEKKNKKREKVAGDLRNGLNRR